MYSPTDKTEIDVYVYFDKLYVLVTVIFVIVLLFSPVEFMVYVFAIYIITMIAIYFYLKNGKINWSSLFSFEFLKDKGGSGPIGGSGIKPKDVDVGKPQVYHIANNMFSYENADAVCKAYDGRLATYKELEDAYKNGADWCSYGWSEGQNAFFPTQQRTFDELQKIKGHEQDCGRPGINGGYISDPSFQFGVNCYGKKPNMTDNDKKLMDVTTPYPKNPQDILMEKQISFWKEHMPSLLVSPFNRTSWSEPYLRV
jgi:Extracellular link domain